MTATAQAGTTTSSNQGAYLYATTFQGQTDATIIATGGGGSHYNYGAYLYVSKVTAVTGVVTVTGSARNDTSGIANTGLQMLSTTIAAATNATLTGSGGDGTSSNRGLYTSSGSITATSGAIIASGTANSTTTGSSTTGRSSGTKAGS